MKPIRLMMGFFTVGGWTMASRVLGLVRDLMIAAFLGAGPVAEAFLVAFALPNMFRRFFAEGAFNTAFIPLFSKKVEKGEDALGFANDAFAALGSLLIVFTLLAQLFMPWLVLAMASGFAGDERFPLAVVYGRIAFGYILFISLAALCSGVLNTAGRFAAAAAAPVLLNVILVSALLFAESGLFRDLFHIDINGGPDAASIATGTILTWGVLIAGIAQLALVWWAAGRAGFPIRPRLPRLTPDMDRLCRPALPVAAGGRGHRRGCRAAP